MSRPKRNFTVTHFQLEVSKPWNAHFHIKFWVETYPLIWAYLYKKKLFIAVPSYANSSGMTALGLLVVIFKSITLSRPTKWPISYRNFGPKITIFGMFRPIECAECSPSCHRVHFKTGRVFLNSFGLLLSWTKAIWYSVVCLKLESRVSHCRVDYGIIFPIWNHVTFHEIAWNWTP